MFCSCCGKSTGGGVATEIKKAAVAEVLEAPVVPPEQPAPDLDINTFVTPPPPVVPEIKAPKEPKPKTFFGVGALVICLVTIGLLSISTGVFAALYLNAIL